MRIGIFTDTYPPYINGVSTSIAMLEKALIKQGHQVFIVTVNSEKYSYENEEKIIRIPGIPIGIYDYRLTGVYPLRAISKIKEWNLDIIHSHTEFGVGTFARIIAKQLNIPLVHTYHTMYEDYIHYITKGYFLAPGKKIVEYLTKFYCDKTATELIVPTKKAYDLFKEKYKFDRNVNIVPTGIELERFYKENNELVETNKIKKELNIEANDFVIISVGRLAAEKSFELLIEGHTEIVKKNKHAKLLIIGDGPDSEKYKELASKLKIRENVIFTGKVPWEEIHKYYQLATVFATASRTETQGLTVIEAMAASIAVICADDESFKEVVIDNLNGKLFSDQKDYVKVVLELMNDKEKIQKMGKQARISSEVHSSRCFAEQVLAVYKIAIKPNMKKTTFFGKLKNVVKKGFNGK
ncbi:MAG: glycosyltransferase family 4 protein [Bacilli bacterium]